MTPKRRVTWQATSNDEEFFATFGGAVAGPLAARAQQAAAMPVVGFLGAVSVIGGALN